MTAPKGNRKSEKKNEKAKAVEMPANLIKYYENDTIPVGD